MTLDSKISLVPALVSARSYARKDGAPWKSWRSCDVSMHFHSGLRWRISRDGKARLPGISDFLKLCHFNELSQTSVRANFLNVRSFELSTFRPFDPSAYRTIEFSNFRNLRTFGLLEAFWTSFAPVNFSTFRLSEILSFASLPTCRTLDVPNFWSPECSGFLSLFEKLYRQNLRKSPFLRAVGALGGQSRTTNKKEQKRIGAVVYKEDTFIFSNIKMCLKTHFSFPMNPEFQNRHILGLVSAPFSK